MRTSFLTGALVAWCACGGDEAGSGPIDARLPPPADARILPPADAGVAFPPLEVGLLVGSRGTNLVLRFDGSGAPQGVFASDPALVRPVGITFGPDGNVYVAAGDTDHVLRLDGATGASLGVFTHGATISSPRNVNFGPDGAFYVADGFRNQILRFDGTTGQLDRVFIEHPTLQGPTSFTFGPDGNVYVVSVLTDRVLRFDGTTGALIGAFAKSSLVQPHDVSFGPDGNLYVTNSGSTLVQRFRADSGAHIDAFVDDAALIQPLGMAWGPDGNLYVANQGGGEIRRYDGVTGAFMDVFVASGAGGLTAPAFFVFLPRAQLVVAVIRDGTMLAISGARPGARVLLVRGTAGGTGSLADCPSLTLPVGDPMVVQARMADESGYVVAAIAAGQTWVGVDTSRCVAAAAR
jgi:sugar lactone lactonase YvrE